MSGHHKLLKRKYVMRSTINHTLSIEEEEEKKTKLIANRTRKKYS